MTDGSANVGSDPEKAASEITKSQIPIYTIGIGKKDNNPLTYTDLNGQKNFFYDANGEKIIGDLDDELLQKIAIKRIIFSIIFSVVLLLFAFSPLFPTFFQINICGTDTLENCANGLGWLSLITLPIGLTLGIFFFGRATIELFRLIFRWRIIKNSETSE